MLKSKTETERECVRCGAQWTAPVAKCPECCCGAGEGCSAPKCTGTPGAVTPEPADVNADSESRSSLPAETSRRAPCHPECWDGVTGGWQVGDRAVADVRGFADVEVIRTDDPGFPWRSERRIPDFFGPQTQHAERHVKNARPLA